MACSGWKGSRGRWSTEWLGSNSQKGPPGIEAEIYRFVCLEGSWMAMRRKRRRRRRPWNGRRDGGVEGEGMVEEWGKMVGRVTALK